MKLALSSHRNLSILRLAALALGTSLAALSWTGCSDSCHYTYAGQACLDLGKDPDGGGPGMLTCPSRADALAIFSPPGDTPKDVVSVDSDGTLSSNECCYDVHLQHYCE